MSFDLITLRETVSLRGAVVRVVITRDVGSAPRGAGTSMLVWSDGQSGTIGGGELEYRATQEARNMLSLREDMRQQTMPLGPALGQCCGGSVSLVWERFETLSLPEALPFARPLPGQDGPMPAPVLRKAKHIQPGSNPAIVEGWIIETGASPSKPLWIWGAGHVGREIIDILAPLPDFQITWSDTGVDRFPESISDAITVLPAAEPAMLAAHAPYDAHHIILTYSHDLDLKLCDALLRRGFESCGLIGSATKWARFQSRLTALGHRREDILRIACPIGDPTLGKHPRAIALGVATSLIKQADMKLNRGDSAGDRHTA